MVVENVQQVPTYLHLNFENDDQAETVSLPGSLHSDHPSLEQISIRKLKSVEKGSIYPYLGLTFIKGSVFEDDNNNNCCVSTDDHSGVFECVQLIAHISKGTSFRHRRRRRAHCISDDGYLVFAYQTMEDMYNTNFAASWKTWTGARLLCQLLPEKFTVKRLSFFKKVKGCSSFAYVMIAQIEDLMLDCAPALNVLHCIRPKICAFIGAYRGSTFMVDNSILRTLYVDEEEQVNAYTSHLRVIYSNHSAHLEFPAFMEYRDSYEQSSEAVRDQTEEKTTRSEETQTVNLDMEHVYKRSLPRTISIYDFPSMQRSPKLIDEYEMKRRKSVFKEESTKSPRRSSPISNGIIDRVDSPIGSWIRKTSRKKVRVAFSDGVRPRSASLNRSSLTDKNKSPIPKQSVAGNSLESEEWANVMNALTELARTASQMSLQPPTETHVKARRSHSNISTTCEKKEIAHDDNSLLRRLKEQYFNSPEYTREELRTAASELGPNQKTFT